MAQQTALQELIEWFDELPEYDKSSEGYSIIEKAKELIHKEKEQIMMAFNDGKVNSVLNKRNSEQYYNQTYT